MATRPTAAALLLVASLGVLAPVAAADVGIDIAAAAAVAAAAGNATLPEPLIRAHHEYRRTLALRRCVMQGYTGYNCSAPNTLNYYWSPAQHLWLEDHLVLLDPSSKDPPCALSWYTGAIYGWTAANLTAALPAIARVAKQVLLAECVLRPDCTAWRGSQRAPADVVGTALEAGGRRLAATLAALGAGVRLCPRADTAGVVASAAAYPGFGSLSVSRTSLQDWPYAFIAQGALSNPDIQTAYSANTLVQHLGSSRGLPQLESLVQLVLTAALGDPLLTRLKLEARSGRYSPRGAASAAARVQEAQAEADARQRAPAEAAAGASGGQAARRLSAASCSPSDFANTLAGLTYADAQCAYFKGRAADATGRVEASFLAVPGSSETLPFISAQMALLLHLVRTAPGFLFSDDNARLLLLHTNWPEVADNTVRLRARGSRAAAQRLNRAGLAGLACAAPGVAGGYLKAAAAQCAGAGACDADVCTSAARGYLDWEPFAGVELALPPPRAAPQLAGAAPASSPGLPEPVLRAHYAFRSALAVQRCLAKGMPTIPCNSTWDYESDDDDFLSWDKHLVPLQGGAVPAGSCGTPYGAAGAQAGWTSGNLTAALAAILRWLPQVLYNECGMTAACRQWRAGTANPLGVIQAAVQRGSTKMAAWVASQASKARLCPLPDSGGLIATAAKLPLTSNELYGVHDFAAGVLATAEPEMLPPYTRNLMRAQPLVRKVFDTSSGLDRVESLQGLLVHFSLSDTLLATLRAGLSLRRMIRQQRVEPRRLVPKDHRFDPYHDPRLAPVAAAAHAHDHGRSHGGGGGGGGESAERRRLAAGTSALSDAASRIVPKSAITRDFAPKGRFPDFDAVMGAGVKLAAAAQPATSVAAQVNGLLAVAKAAPGFRFTADAKVAAAGVDVGSVVTGILRSDAGSGLSIRGLASQARDFSVQTLNRAAGPCAANSDAGICRAAQAFCYGAWGGFVPSLQDKAKARWKAAMTPPTPAASWTLDFLQAKGYAKKLAQAVARLQSYAEKAYNYFAFGKALKGIKDVDKTFHATFQAKYAADPFAIEAFCELQYGGRSYNQLTPAEKSNFEQTVATTRAFGGVGTKAAFLKAADAAKAGATLEFQLP